MDESPDWFRLGVEARIAGRPRTENPLLGPGALPEVTGQSFGAWRADMDLWWEGWEAEDRRRAGPTVVENDRRSR
jgi:hypothetical protein